MTLEQVPRYEPNQVSSENGTAIVIGGSMAGLLAARVVADRFDRVTIVERDPLRDEPVPRRGVPQGAHPHVLWPAGSDTMEDLFPGFGEELLSAGGLQIDGDRDFLPYDQGGFFASGTNRIPIYFASRPLIELVVRRLVRELDGIDIRSECQFMDYLVDDRSTTVTGVKIRDEQVEESDLTADLVVDATGRTSRTPDWLENHGFESPRVEEFHVDVGYSTTIIERPRSERWAVFIGPDPPRKRGGGAFPIEGDRWLVNLHGIHGDHPPTDREGLESFAASLPIPHIKDLLSAHEWVSEDIEYYPFPSHQRYYYEELDEFPDGLVVTGDAIASFNPIFGQGMSVAALEALQLHHALADRPRSTVALQFFERAETAVDPAWMIATGSDLQFDETEGPKPRGTDIVNWYFSRLTKKAHSNPELSEAFARVIFMEKPPTSLFRPKIAVRVLSPFG